MSLPALWIAAFLGVLWSLASPALAAVVIKTQAPCVTDAGHCIHFTDTGTIPVIRSFQFIAPRKGTASVTLQGTLYCASNADGSAFVDLVGQIVPRAGANPNASGPGGLRHTIVLSPQPAGTSNSFNLAPRRVFSVTDAGIQKYHFKIARNRMDANTQCWVYNAAFSVMFVPR
jgi:hypothetical protein